MTTETVKHVDLQLVVIKGKVFVVPQSVLGLLWLQTHFKDEHWDSLASGSVIINREDAGMLVIDAQSAELIVIYE